MLAFIVPGIIIGCIAIFHRKSYTDLHNGLLGLFLAQALVLIVTDSIKVLFLTKRLCINSNRKSQEEQRKNIMLSDGALFFTADQQRKVLTLFFWCHQKRVIVYFWAVHKREQATFGVWMERKKVFRLPLSLRLVFFALMLVCGESSWNGNLGRVEENSLLFHA